MMGEKGKRLKSLRAALGVGAVKDDRNEIRSKGDGGNKKAEVGGPCKRSRTTTKKRKVIVGDEAENQTNGTVSYKQNGPSKEA